jgi:hypothetical protein
MVTNYTLVPQILELTAILWRNFVHWVPRFIMSFNQIFWNKFSIRIFIMLCCQSCFSVLMVLFQQTMEYYLPWSVTAGMSNLRPPLTIRHCHFATEKKLNVVYSMNKLFRKKFQSRFSEPTSKGSWNNDGFSMLSNY